MNKNLFAAVILIICLIGLVVMVICALASCPVAAHADTNNTLRNEAIGISLALGIDKAGHRFAKNAEDRNICDGTEAKEDRITRCGPIDSSVLRLWMDSKELRKGTLWDIRRGYRLGMWKNTLDALRNRGDFDPSKYADEGHRKTAKNFVVAANVVLPALRIHLPKRVKIVARERKVLLLWSKEI